MFEPFDHARYHAACNDTLAETGFVRDEEASSGVGIFVESTRDVVDSVPLKPFQLRKDPADVEVTNEPPP